MSNGFQVDRYPRCPTRSRQRRGAVLALLAILLPVLLVLAAFAINIAYIETTNTEIQIATDAAARSATRTYVLTGDKSLALAAAQDAAARNPIGDVVLPLGAVDLEYGISLRTSLDQPYDFHGATQGNSIRLTTRTLANSNGDLIPIVFPMLGSNFQIRPLVSSTSTQVTVDVALVVDRSGSMAFSSSETAVEFSLPSSAPAGWAFGDPAPPNARWLDLVAAVGAFQAELDASLDNERLSLSTYNHWGWNDVPPTTDYSQIDDALTAISYNFVAGGTNIGDGMLYGLAALNDAVQSRPFASKVMVVMTDGNHNTGTSPTYAADIAAQAGVTIYTVTFSDEANQPLMQAVAAIGGGEQYHAIDAAQLQDAFQQIARRLPTILTN